MGIPEVEEVSVAVATDDERQRRSAAMLLIQTESRVGAAAFPKRPVVRLQSGQLRAYPLGAHRAVQRGSQ